MRRETERIINAALDADPDVPRGLIPEAILKLKGKHLDPVAKLEAVAVSQARVCDLLSCSRFHVRKLVLLGLLPQRDIGGLKRYLVSDVNRVATGTAATRGSK